MADLKDIVITTKADLIAAFRAESMKLKEEWLAEMRQEQEDDGAVMTTCEIEEMTGYSRTSITKKIQAGILVPVGKANNKLLFSKRDVLDRIKTGQLRIQTNK